MAIQSRLDAFMGLTAGEVDQFAGKVYGKLLDFRKMTPTQLALDGEYQSLKKIVDFYGKDTIKNWFTIGGRAEGDLGYIGLDATREGSFAAHILDVLFP